MPLHLLRLNKLLLNSKLISMLMEHSKTSKRKQPILRLQILSEVGLPSFKQRLTQETSYHTSVRKSKPFKVNAMLSILFHQPHFISLLFTSKTAKNDQLEFEMIGEAGIVIWNTKTKKWMASS